MCEKAEKQQQQMSEQRTRNEQKFEEIGAKIKRRRKKKRKCPEIVTPATHGAPQRSNECRLTQPGSPARCNSHELQ
jgi:hypothetical protein